MFEVDRQHYGYVYKTTNKINGNYYIGQKKINADSGDWMSYLGSGIRITIAIEKYGKESFKKELIGYASNQDELDILEVTNIRSAKKKDGDRVYNIAMDIVPSPQVLRQGNKELDERMQESMKRALSKQKEQRLNKIIEDRRLIEKTILEMLRNKDDYIQLYIETRRVIDIIEKMINKIEFAESLYKKDVYVIASNFVAIFLSDYKGRPTESQLNHKRKSIAEAYELKRIENMRKCNNDKCCNWVSHERSKQSGTENDPTLKRVYRDFCSIECSMTCSDFLEHIEKEKKKELYIINRDKEIVKLYTENEWSSPEIGSKFNVSHGTVLKVLKVNGIKSNPRGYMSKTRLESIERQRKTIPPRTCPSCNEEFIPQRITTRTCSKKCYHEYIGYAASHEGKAAIEQHRNKYSKKDIAEMSAQGMTLSAIKYNTMWSYKDINKALKK